jgi:cytochrome P450
MLHDRKLPVLGHALSYAADPAGFLERTARTRGSIAEIRVLGRDIWLLSHPDHISRILREDAHRFRKPYGDFPVVKALVGNGLAASDGEFWLRQRRMAQPAFHKSRIAGYAATMHRLTVNAVAPWKYDQHLDMHASVSRMTLEIVAACLFGNVLVGNERVHGIVSEVMRLCNDQVNKALPMLERLPTPANLAYARGLARLEGVLKGMIAAGRSHGEDNSLLWMLIEARDDEDRGMTDAQLMDELKTLFLAGFDSSANAVTWALYLLSQHPDVAHELRLELDVVLNGAAVTLDALPRLPFLDAVIRESLRLYPPAWNVARIAREDVRFGDAVVRAGQVVFMSPYVIHRDPQWYAQPEVFRPRRWLDGLARRLPEFAYLPFSGGIRKCIGDDFAKLEIAVILGALCQRFAFQLEPGFRLRVRAGMTLRPERGLRMIVKERPSG